jgi:hypothetical protein
MSWCAVRQLPEAGDPETGVALAQRNGPARECRRFRARGGALVAPADCLRLRVFWDVGTSGGSAGFSTFIAAERL